MVLLLSALVDGSDRFCIKSATAETERSTGPRYKQGCGWDQVICQNKRRWWFKLRSLQFRQETTREKISVYICFSVLELANLDRVRSYPRAQIEGRTKATKLVSRHRAAETPCHLWLSHHCRPAQPRQPLQFTLCVCSRVRTQCPTVRNQQAKRRIKIKTDHREDGKCLMNAIVNIKL